MEGLIFGILLYYMKSINTQYKNRYKNTYSSNQNEKKNNQPRPQGFSLKNGWGGTHPFFKGKALGTRLKNNEQSQNHGNCVLLLLVDLTIYRFVYTKVFQALR